MFSSAVTTAATTIPLLAQAGGGQKYGIGWGLIILSVVLGLILTLTPARRTYEVKKPVEE